jgi:hypothetical protein
MTSETDSAPDKSTPIRKDSFFGWDQLILLVTPFPILAVADLAYIFGWNHNAADGIRAIYLMPLVLASFGSLFIAPIMLVSTLLVRKRRAEAVRG